VTRGQRRTHAIVFRLLAVLLCAVLSFALWRRHVVAATESAPLGRAPIHDGAAP
jgi:hypothetical protein